MITRTNPLSKRANWWDYQSPMIYMLTLTKRDYVPSFGRVAGNSAAVYGQPDYPRTYPSPIGRRILAKVSNLRYRVPGLSVLQYSLMPDHLHLLIRITERTPYRLEYHIYDFLKDIDEDCLVRGLLSDEIRIKLRDTTHPYDRNLVFHTDFNDQMLTRGRDLNTMFKYIRENPFRLLVRHENPTYFSRIRELEISGTRCQLYGNMDLICHPSIDAVVIRSRFSEMEMDKLRNRWRYTAGNGGVLAGAFISKGEKEVMRECLELGGRIILLHNQPFGDRDKPVGQYFELCMQGRLLMICPLEESFTRLGDKQRKDNITRAECLWLNDFAGRLSEH